MSSLLKALVESSWEFGFGEAQDVELKGLAGSHQVSGLARGLTLRIRSWKEEAAEEEEAE